MSITIASFDTPTPDDFQALEAWINTHINTFTQARLKKLAIFVKVAGDYDDGSRERSRLTLSALIERHGLTDRSQLFAAVGCEGVATPFGYVLAQFDRSDADANAGPPRLAMGFARSAPPPPALLERAALAPLVSATVRAAMADGGLTAAEVVMIFVKVPQAPGGGSAGQVIRGRRTRGIAALGAGIALGEVEPARVNDDTVGVDTTLYARRVQNFSGPEVRSIEVIAIGNLPGAGGDLVAYSTQMSDLIDTRALRSLLIGAGMTVDSFGDFSTPERLAGLFIKAGVRSDGTIRGAKTTVFESSSTPEKQMRAALSGVLAGLLGTTRFFSTGDPIHAARDGGATVCAIVRAVHA